jgi:hypothetical protein
MMQTAASQRRQIPLNAKLSSCEPEMTAAPTTRIRVFPSGELKLRQRLFHALQAAFNVQFLGCDRIDTDEKEPIIVLANGASVEKSLEESKRAWFLVSAQPGRRIPHDNSTLRFHDVPKVSLCLGVIPLQEKELVGTPLADESGSGWKKALACDEGTLWLWKNTSAGFQYRVGVAPQELKEGEFLFDYVQPGRFAHLLPLLHFVKWTGERDQLEPMPPTATMIIDDPNLHWPSYGYVDFKDLLKHTHEYDYHAVIATVPLDSWWSHSAVRALFHENPGRLSLTMHGNDHTKLEVARPRSEQAALQLFAQGLRRIESFEARTGLRVARVMEPPFGVVSIRSLWAMHQLGYSGGLMAHDNELEWYRHEPWPAHFGVREVDFAVEGFPTVSRRRIVADWKTGAALNFCLGQPVMIATHHTDAVGDLAQFAEAAELLKATGPVKWLGVDDVFKSLYRTRQNGETLYVRPYSTNIAVSVPRGVREISLIPSDVGFKNISVRAGDGRELQKAENGRIKLNGYDRLQVHSRSVKSMDFKTVPELSFSPWAYVRRTLTATRDRGTSIVKNGKRRLPQTRDFLKQ